MLKTPVLHPEILAALGGAGHLSKVLISDGNYPHNTEPFAGAPVVYANFVPGVIDAVTALQIVADLVPIETVEVMAPAKTGEYAKKEPPIWARFREVLKKRSDFRGDLVGRPKPDFNQEAKSEDLCLVIATAETALYANILITIGVIMP